MNTRENQNIKPIPGNPCNFRFSSSCTSRGLPCITEKERNPRIFSQYWFWRWQLHYYDTDMITNYGWPSTGNNTYHEWRTITHMNGLEKRAVWTRSSAHSYLSRAISDIRKKWSQTSMTNVMKTNEVNDQNMMTIVPGSLFVVIWWYLYRPQLNEELNFWELKIL